MADAAWVAVYQGIYLLWSFIPVSNLTFVSRGEAG